MPRQKINNYEARGDDSNGEIKVSLRGLILSSGLTPPALVFTSYISNHFHKNVINTAIVKRC